MRNHKEVIKIHASREDLGRGYRIKIGFHNEATGEWRAAQPVEVAPVSDGEAMPVAFELTNAEAQLFMDSLWDAGCRPSNGEGSRGQLAATEKHLKDMKTIAFHALKISEAQK